MRNTLQNVQKRIREKFRFSTLSFIFILTYVSIFPRIFGPENNIVAVIFTIMMSASMVRDLTATPVKHLFIQAFVLVWMAFAACMVNVLPASASFAVNFVTLLFILYAYTYEYASHIYFPYILSYLFLIFISPVGVDLLPRRMAGMVFGAVCIILYQWFMGRNRVVETARDVLTEMIDDICAYISYRLGDRTDAPDLTDTRHRLCHLSSTVYQRRKKSLCVSDAGFAMIAAGRGLEHVLILLHQLPETLSEAERRVLSGIAEELGIFRAFVHEERTDLPAIERPDFSDPKEAPLGDHLYEALSYTRDRMLHMTDPEKQAHYHKTAMSLQVRLLAAIDFSPVRAIYALRTALLLSLAVLLVQVLALPHGKWFLFTLGSVSLPYADDVPLKVKKRIQATITGGLASVVIYSLIDSPTGRTAAMMLSGYLSFYLTDYAETFACSTVGALGGAVFMNAFGLPAVGSIFLIRLGYILAGAAVGYAVNCLICPYSRAKATRQLWTKYQHVSDLLAHVCRSVQPDPQLYYSLVIQAHLLEDKLTQNAKLEDWGELSGLLLQCREEVRNAHLAGT